MNNQSHGSDQFGILESENILCWAIRVRGTVQGVGFRPTVFNLAQKYGITGQVVNDGEGVLIDAWSTKTNLSKFMHDISVNSPPLARIESIEHNVISHLVLAARAENPPESFVIGFSVGGITTTNISPDASVCSACLSDIHDSLNRRYRYPFTNCTHCGPRLSIIKSIPYDRAYTSMGVFRMCSDCQQEYDDPADRRFHAQPNACHKCGPKVWLESCDSQPLENALFEGDQIEVAAALIADGKIVAIKGVGGFHLACDATNKKAVARLRQGKLRDDKPFALMAKNLAMVEEYCLLSTIEAKAIASQQAPVVVLERITDSTANLIAPAVAPGQKTLGFMLPYTPLHHLLLEELNKPIVLTSANFASEPQCIDNEQVRSRLAGTADYLLLHNRDIVNRLDDSVVRVSRGQITYLRRARGAAPEPIKLPPGFENASEILAMGAELKNTFCLIKGGKAILSQHIGDLEEAKTFADYKSNLAFYDNCFQHSAARIAVDLHPDYLSSKLGRSLATAKDLALDEIQHHHAHIASCLADNAYPLSQGAVLGIALDGIGFGADGTFWGGEFLLADYSSFERLGTFKPVEMLGGSQAMKEPWRNTYAHLMAATTWSDYKSNFENLALTKFLESKALATFNSMLKSGINSPLASSCGRLFDAAAAAVGVCRERATYEGQAAIEFEAMVNTDILADQSEVDYNFKIVSLKHEIPYIEPQAVWRSVFNDLASETDKGTIAARFHKGLAKVIVQLAVQLCFANGRKQINTVALSGGVFQNKILEELVHTGLRAAGLQVLTHHQVPANDGGLALGQAVISAALQMRENQKTKEEEPCALAYPDK
ncbi:carbamoyltransferase HypF [soil metagenome]